MINNQILPKEKTIHISKGTGKLERFKLIGTNTKTNPFCIISNSKEKDIFKRIKKFVNKDYKNNNHMINICKICNKNPMTTFALWTKRKDIIKGFFKHNEKPSNLIMVYSNPKVNQILETPPKYFDKVFNNVWKDSYITQQNCTGQKCIECLECYKKDGKTVIVEAVKRFKGKLTTICQACYSHKGINFRKALYEPLQRNSNLLSNDLIDLQIPVFNELYVRFQHHGELLDNLIVDRG
jgi:hypothetical protein